MERVIYIPRGFSHESLKRHMRSWWNRTFSYTGQEGYFEAGLNSAFLVTRSSPENFEQREKDHDLLIVNYKCDLLPGKERNETIQEIGRQSSLPSILFVGTDRSADIPPDEVLDQYNIVFKRECFKDKDRYPISNQNKDKIYPTMLACPIFTSLSWLPFRLKEKISTTSVGPGYDCDVFFSGQAAAKNRVRLNAWEAVAKGCSDCRVCGGLQPHPSRPEETPDELQADSLSRPAYAHTARHSKINLALDGIGEFTFRHLEIWYFGGFLISSPSIREIDIPLPIKEGVHFVAFDNEADLVDKIRYYKANEAEREKIARAGKEMFEEYYNPTVHGNDIRAIIEPYL